MAFCYRCGNGLVEGSAFCNACGAPQAQQQAAYQPQPTTLVPTVDPQAEEQEFLELTHRLLRWERKAWSIAGKVYLITGIIFAALFFLIGIAFVAAGDYVLEAMGVIYLLYSIIFGGMFVAFGIVNQKAADKIPFYIENLYVDFHYAADRCGSVGMLVFSAIFGDVARIFFIINFVRMKANKAVINRIIARQQQG